MKIDLSFREFYPHPIEKVWRAISSREGLAFWLMENDFEPVMGRRFQFRYAAGPNGRGWIDCEVLALEPPTRIVWSWQATESDRDGLVEIQLKTIEGGTELTLAHTGDTDPDRRSRYAAGWPGKFADLHRLLSQS